MPPEPLVSHIGKFLLTRKGEDFFETSIAQVGGMALAVPTTLRARKGPEGSLIISWRWLPGEPEEELIFKRSVMMGPGVEALLARLRETKPWRLG